ncbi:MAG: hypothetical protein CL670_13320 [Balneola sp.]|jgi:hypothetical protein|nr:hypothetical protein [Balneola sp.]MAL19048.1 hypothetical protein [Balneola sp.]MBE80130.1 hypothetical protein [Balneola sp.]|tara:strand:- start:300 stop:506 length:207 start_codon:yes stop_codon:yes gene_type:complete
MSLKNKTKKELQNRINELEGIIAKKGVGSDYLSKAERIQRDLNLALILGGAAALVGVTAWTLFSSTDE